jgi:L-glutamine-phosphate cytidylyltransferase
MRACILAAGIGQRLRPLTDDRPKALVEIDGRSFLDRMIESLLAVGVDELVVATGYRADAVARALSDVPVRVVLRNNDAYEHTQNSVSLYACRDALVAGGAVDTFKLDGDVLFDVDVLKRLLAVRKATEAGLIAAIDARDSLGTEEMKVEVSGDRIMAFGKQLDPQRAAGESIGIELIGAERVATVLDAIGTSIRGGRSDRYYEDVYDDLLLAHGGTVDARAAFVTDLPWTEVDTLDDLKHASEIARRLRQCSPTAPR